MRRERMTRGADGNAPTLPRFHASTGSTNSTLVSRSALRVLCASVVMILGNICPGWQIYLLAADACPQQPDYRSQCPVDTTADPNTVLLPILGLPGPAEPNVWSTPCGPGRWAYTACDPEGQPMRGEVISADLVAELTITADGMATLTVPHVTPDWHVIHVRITDAPPPDCLTPASRDVLIVFRGEPGANLPPVLMGIWGGTSL